MEHWRHALERFFDAAHQRLSELSLEWQKHTNRRTLLTLIFVGTTTTVVYLTFIAPPDRFPAGELITVPKGASLSETANSFQEQGIVRSALGLKLLMKLTGNEDNVHAGDYLFKVPRDIFSVAHAVSTGSFGLEPTRFRVPEGATVKRMATLFDAGLQRFDKERFIENATSYEGFLFPDTYFFLPNATDDMVLETLRNNFETQYAALEEKYGTSTRSRKDIVTMASILEKEAQIAQDRRMIAGVLWKRLDKGMLLQVDAVFLYTLGRTTFDLTMADLRSDSPYNTYKYKGLPPTPIGSPSLDSLIAAMTPIKSEYYYYLADHNHVTHYSRTYQEHLEKKALYLGT